MTTPVSADRRTEGNPKLGMTVPVDVSASVRDALVAELGVDATAVAGHAELAMLPGMESVKLLRIVSALEEAHGVSLDDDVLFSIETVDDLVRTLGGDSGADKPGEGTGS